MIQVTELKNLPLLFEQEGIDWAVLMIDGTVKTLNPPADEEP